MQMKWQVSKDILNSFQSVVFKLTSYKWKGFDEFDIGEYHTVC